MPDESSRAPNQHFVRQFIVFDRLGVILGALLVVVVNGLFLRSAGVWPILPILLTLAALLSLGLSLLDSGHTLWSLAAVVGGNWLIALAVPALFPFLWPVMVITVLAPIVLAAPYLKQSHIVLVLFLAGLITALVATIGLLNDDGGVIVDIDDTFELVIVIGSLVAQIIPVGFIAWENNRQQNKQVERLTTLNESLTSSEIELVKSRRRLVDVADSERRRIEADLHDGAQQRLVALRIKLTMFETKADDEDTRQLVREVTAELDETVREVRELAHGIYPTLLQTLGLASALASIARSRTPPVEVRGQEVAGLDNATSAALYFVALEALANASKHASDSKVLVELSTDATNALLVVSDQGPGFDPSSQSESYGMQSMGDRIEAVGGSLAISSAPGRGTTLLAKVPLP